MANEENNKYVWVGIIIVAAVIGVFWLWLSNASSTGSSSKSCYTATEARDHVGTRGCVTFNVSYTYTSAAGNIFLDEYEDYSTGFAVYIPSGSSASDITPSDYEDKELTVTGEISLYKGNTQIEVTEESQLQTD